MPTLVHTRILDVRDGRFREAELGIEEGKIQSIGAAKAAAGSIDLEGAYILPGLISCHTHLSIVFPFHETNEGESPAITALRCQRRANEALHAGVTTVRTVGEMHRADIALRHMIRSGWATGPRIVSGGKSISVTGGHGCGFGALVADGADGFLKAAREELRAGADHIKIFITGGIAQKAEGFAEPQMTAAEMEAVVAAARSRDTYVCAHSGGSRQIIRAARTGVRCFEHCYQLDREAARTIKTHHGYVVPTLGVTRSPEWMKSHGFEPWTIDKALAAGSEHLESIATAIREGVPVVNGTDIPPGAVNDGTSAAVREMAFMVDAGLSPLDAIRASSIRPAEMMRIDSEVGALEPGYQADLIAVREDPLKDIRALEKIFFVMQAGRVIRWDRQ